MILIHSVIVDSCNQIYTLHSNSAVVSRSIKNKLGNITEKENKEALREINRSLDKLEGNNPKIIYV